MRDRMNNLLNKGKKIISENKHQKWEKTILTLYNGADKISDKFYRYITTALTIIEKLNLGQPPEDIEKKYNIKNRNDRLSSYIIKRLVLEFSDKGIEFYKLITPVLSEDEQLLITKITEENESFTRK